MSIPNYLISLFTIPISMALKIEFIFRNFLWNDFVDCHHFYLVDWKMICRPVMCVGLGIRQMRHHNHALLAKWLWRFGTERDSLWRRVVVAIFDELNMWRSNEVRARYGCELWKSILKMTAVFWSFIRFKLG